MGGSGGTRTETTPTAASIPPELQPLVNKAVQGTTDAMDNVSPSDFTGVNIQNIPGLTPEEQQWMQQIFGWAGDPTLTQGAEQGMDLTRSAGGMSKGEQDAMDQLTKLGQMGPVNAGSVGSYDASATGAGVDTNTRQMKRAEEIAQGLTVGDVGSSPATIQAMKAWEQFVKPQVMAGQALTGNLGGGSTEEALGLSSTAALTPLMAKEIDTRQAMAEMLGQLGLGASGQELAASQTNAELGTRVSEGNASRKQSADVANMTARLQAAGMDRATAAQVASMTASIAANAQGRKLQAGGQLAAIGTEKANLKIAALSKALETAGMPRDIATKQAQAEYNDMLRRQSLMESMYFAPTGNFLAGALTPGSLVQQRQTGGGLFGS